MATQDSRIRLKRSTISGTTPDIGPSSDHTDGTWAATDIYVSEPYLNTADNQVWVGFNSNPHCIYGNVKKTITSAQVLTLNGTPVPFGISVPAGFYISPLRADCYIDFNSAAYATNTNLRIRAVGATAGDFIIGANGILAAVGNTFAGLAMQNGAANSINFITAADFEVFVPTGNPTAGDSDITIYLTYMLIPV